MERETVTILLRFKIRGILNSMYVFVQKSSDQNSKYIKIFCIHIRNIPAF